MTDVQFPKGVPTAVLNAVYALLWLEALGYKAVSRPTLGVVLDKTPRGLDYAVRMGMERGLIARITVNQRTVISVTDEVRKKAQLLFEKGRQANVQHES